MGLLESFQALFKKGEPPLPVLEQPQLGRLTWVADEEAWAGNVDGCEFLLGYDGSPHPNAAVVDYAVSVLADQPWLRSEIDKAKMSLPSSLRPFNSEIQGLTLGPILFYAHKDTLRMFIELRGGLDYRCWRMEFAGKTFDGLGFDS